MMKLTSAIFILLTLPLTAFAQLDEMDASAFAATAPALTNHEEVYAESNTQLDGIDFNSWESDFDKSVKTQKNDCSGKNCKFKNKQALDPSWDL